MGRRERKKKGVGKERQREIGGEEKVHSVYLPTQVCGSMFSKGRGAPASLDKPDHRTHLTT